jgi:hypothetical protein
VVSLTKPTKTSEELRAMILSEISYDPHCPAGMDVVVRADKDLGWTAEAIPPGSTTWVHAWVNCVSQIGRIVRRCACNTAWGNPKVAKNRCSARGSVLLQRSAALRALEGTISGFGSGAFSSRIAAAIHSRAS